MLLHAMKHHLAATWVTAHLVAIWWKILFYTLTEIFDKNSIDLIFKKWLSTDRATLQTVLQNSEEFTKCFHAVLQTLKKHDFIAKEQSKFVLKKK